MRSQTLFLLFVALLLHIPLLFGVPGDTVNLRAIQVENTPGQLFSWCLWGSWGEWTAYCTPDPSRPCGSGVTRRSRICCCPDDHGFYICYQVRSDVSTIHYVSDNRHPAGVIPKQGGWKGARRLKRARAIQAVGPQKVTLKTGQSCIPPDTVHLNGV